MIICACLFSDKHYICGHKCKIRHTSFEIYRILAKLSSRAQPYIAGFFCQELTDLSASSFCFVCTFRANAF